MMFWALPATTVSPVDHEPQSAIAAPASTTTPRSLQAPIRWPPEESLLALSSTTVREVEVSIQPAAASVSVSVSDASYSEGASEVVPVAVAAVPKAVYRMRARIARVSSPVYEGVGLPGSNDLLDDE